MLHYYKQWLPIVCCLRWGKLKVGPGTPRTKLTDRTANTAAAIMQDDTRMMIRGLANILQIAVSSAHHLLTEILGLSCVCAHWIPWLLTAEHKENRVWIVGETAFRGRWNLLRQDCNLQRDTTVCISTIQRWSSKVVNGWKRAQIHGRKHVLKKPDLKSCLSLFSTKRGWFSPIMCLNSKPSMQNITKQFSWNWSLFTSP